MTDIPSELKKGTDFVYMLNIIDHFSKYAGNFLLKNKKSKIVLNKISAFIEDVGKPIEMGFDNGKEFINKAVAGYLSENNIHIVKGRSYNPRSQGACERIHITIRKALLFRFLEKKKDFNLIEDLELVVKNYNRIIHSVTKYSPIEVFFSNNQNL